IIGIINSVHLGNDSKARSTLITALPQKVRGRGGPNPITKALSAGLGDDKKEESRDKLIGKTKELIEHGLKLPLSAVNVLISKDRLASFEESLKKHPLDKTTLNHALTYAIYTNKASSIEILLNLGADPNSKYQKDKKIPDSAIADEHTHTNDRALHLVIRKLRANQLRETSEKWPSEIKKEEKTNLEATFSKLANHKKTGLDETNSDDLTAINLAADIVKNQRTRSNLNNPDPISKIQQIKDANTLFDMIIGKFAGKEFAGKEFAGKKIDVNKKDKKYIWFAKREREAPLHKIFHKEGIDALIALGADINLKNHENETPLDIAVYNKNLEASITLINNGARISEGAKIYLANIPYDERKSIGYDSYLRAAAKSIGIHLDAEAPITHAQRHEINEKFAAETKKTPQGLYTAGKGLLKKYEPSEQIKTLTNYETSSTGVVSIEQHITEAKIERIISPNFKRINSASQEITYIARMVKTGMAEVDPAKHRGKLYEQRIKSADRKAFYSENADLHVHNRYLALSDFIRAQKITTTDVADAAAKFKSEGKDDSYEFAATNLYLLEIIKGYETSTDPATKSQMLNHLKTLAEIDGRDNILELVKGVENSIDSTTFENLKNDLQKKIKEPNDAINSKVVSEVNVAIDSTPKTSERKHSRKSMGPIPIRTQSRASSNTNTFLASHPEHFEQRRVTKPTSNTSALTTTNARSHVLAQKPDSDLVQKINVPKPVPAATSTVVKAGVKGVGNLEMVMGALKQYSILSKIDMTVLVECFKNTIQASSIDPGSGNITTISGRGINANISDKASQHSVSVVSQEPSIDPGSGDIATIFDSERMPLIYDELSRFSEDGNQKHLTNIYILAQIEHSSLNIQAISIPKEFKDLLRASASITDKKESTKSILDAASASVNLTTDGQTADTKVIAVNPKIPRQDIEYPIDEIPTPEQEGDGTKIKVDPGIVAYFVGYAQVVVDYAVTTVADTVKTVTDTVKTVTDTAINFVGDSASNLLNINNDAGPTDVITDDHQTDAQADQFLDKFKGKLDKITIDGGEKTKTRGQLT
ncbi:MAG: ankyrin repeat domain-containing protein, partial [Legionellales bacterium]|nr:ankyrin repeat domain-containing protein [Legionellales bacterium]